MSHFQVPFDGRGLILRGQARSPYARQLVRQAVMDITDLPIAADEIKA